MGWENPKVPIAKNKIAKIEIPENDLVKIFIFGWMEKKKIWT